MRMISPFDGGRDIFYEKLWNFREEGDYGIDETSV